MMSKHFEESKLVITVDIAYDPDCMDDFHELMIKDVKIIMSEYKMLHKNVDVELKGFICDDK